jgi:hypothetical protein
MAEPDTPHSWTSSPTKLLDAGISTIAHVDPMQGDTHTHIYSMKYTSSGNSLGTSPNFEDGTLPLISRMVYRVNRILQKLEALLAQGSRPLQEYTH